VSAGQRRRQDGEAHNASDEGRDTMGATPVRAVAVPDTVRFWLRIEGAAAFVGGLWLYGQFAGPWLLLLPLLLLPDLSLLGYLSGSAIGAFAYNLVHNWAVGLALIGGGLVAAVPALAIGGAVIVAHVGIDRVLGYGLKHPTSFKETHLQRA
jgi:hypothetical protein